MSVEAMELSSPSSPEVNKLKTPNSFTPDMENLNAMCSPVVKDDISGVALKISTPSLPEVNNLKNPFPSLSSLGGDNLKTPFPYTPILPEVYNTKSPAYYYTSSPHQSI